MEAYRNKDLKNYEIRVHALKSTSKTIGALELSEKAKTLEYAAKEGNTALLEAENDGMLKAYEEQVKNIEEILCRIS